MLACLGSVSVKQILNLQILFDFETSNSSYIDGAISVDHIGGEESENKWRVYTGNLDVPRDMSTDPAHPKKSPFSGNFIAADSDYKCEDMDTSFVTNPINLEKFSKVYLGLLSSLSIYSGNESLSIDVSIDGISWNVIWTASGSELEHAEDPISRFVKQKMVFDVSEYCSRATSVQFRFTYIASCDWHWAIDNILIANNLEAVDTIAFIS
jgi:hypothetical protein